MKIHTFTRLAFLSFVLLAFLFLSSNHFSSNKDIIFTTEIADDAAPEVLTRMLKARDDGVSKVVFEKGTYHFYPDKAFEMLCYISNHEDVLARTAFPIIDVNDLTFDGQGSTFIFHGRMIPFIIEGGTNISLHNLSIDWAVPFHCEGLVVAVDNVSKTFDLKFSDVDSYEIRNGELYFVKEYYEHTIGQSILFDPERKAVAYRANDYTPIATSRKVKVQRNIDKIDYRYKGDHHTIGQIWQGKESVMNAEEVTPGVVRIHGHRKEIPPIGTIVVGKGEKGLNRVSPAIRVKNVVGLHVQNVTVHHANGMAIIVENSENISLDQFNVTPSEGRTLSTTADATHFVGCRGSVELKNCLFECQMDDAMNVHGTYQEVMDILDENTLGVRVGHFEQQNFIIGRKNDHIGLVRLSASFDPYRTLTIRSIEIINGRYQKITFNEKLPAEIQVGDLLENLDAYPEVLVENCTIRGNRARGLLISTPRKTIVKDNYFHTQMEAILVPVESSSWYESGSAANLTIINNTFEDCNHGGHNRGIIRFRTDDDNENIAFHDIEISNNKFRQFDNLILEIANTDGLLFRDNTITASNTFPKLFPDNPAIIIKSSKNVVNEGNTFPDGVKKVLEH